MKIAISSSGNNMSSQLDPRFGRCQYFLSVDTETMEFIVVSNEGISSTGGAGIQAAQTVASMGVSTLITGNVGPNAFQTLSAAGIKVITGVSGQVKDVVEKFKDGTLNETASPTVKSHAGMSGGRRGIGHRAGGK